MIRFLINPAGGRGRAQRHIPRLRELAAEAGAELILSESAEDLTIQARRAADAGVERLLVGGGDGTVHHTLPGLIGSDCALAVLPLGSGNDIAGSLGMPGDLEAAVHQALSGPVATVDCARVEDRPYLGVAGVGFDSAANETANKVRRLSGGLIYIYSVLHTLITFHPPSFDIEYEGGRYQDGAMLVVLANTPRFGGGMKVAPEARMDDGLLDLVIVRAVPKHLFLRVFPKVYKGEHISHPAVFTARTSWAQVRLDPPLHVYGDGERLVPVPEGGVHFAVMPGAVRVVRGV